jgi:hypothetical protein
MKPGTRAALALAPFIAFTAFTQAACASSSARERFGADISDPARPTVHVGELLSTPERYDGSALLIEGEVREVCLRKGCWLTLGSGERELRVTFQDYGFFVPTDCAGARLRAEGVFTVGETSAELTRHYLHDVGKVEEAKQVTAPVKTFTFVASGVELVR